MNAQAAKIWVLASAGLMIVGAFGPWLKALGQSVSGTDGSNDGWLVVAVAAAGGVFFYALRGRRAGAVLALMAGIAGAAITLFDRHDAQQRINDSGALVQGVASIGWGLNLALVASVSLAVAALASQTTQKPSLAAGVAQELPEPELATNHGGAMHRECPFCKEQMRRDASVCPHCRHESAAWRFHEDVWWLQVDGQWKWLNEDNGNWTTFEPKNETSAAPTQ